MKKVVALLIVTALSTAVMVWLAYRIRGYWAVGGEWLGWAALGLYALVRADERQNKKKRPAERTLHQGTEQNLQL